MKKILLPIMMALLLGACTKQFKETNTNPYQITDQSLAQDFNNIGSFYPAMILEANYDGGFFSDQVQENLVYESYSRHMASPTPFNNGANNTTYYPIWNYVWGTCYGGIMPKSQQVLKIARPAYPVFTVWAYLYRVMMMSRVTAIYGPVIYSNYGSQASTVHYDKESDLYNTFFTQLDTINKVLTANLAYTGLTKFDQVYNGNCAQWLKLTNSWRLKLAIRICEVAPALAKTQGEKAMSDPGGLISTNGDNCNIPLYGSILPMARICWQWDDTRMDAAQESFLIGLNDPRLPIWFVPCDPSVNISDHPTAPYKGVRNGAKLVNAKGVLDKTARALICSKVNTSFNTVNFRRMMTAAEVNFDMAEAALRGWSVPGGKTAQYFYEAGVTASFSDWGASGAAGYLANSTNKPLDYKDPVASPINDFVSRSTVTVAWNNGDSNELKLEKIITQKWIDCFTNTLESWCDMRRTGYPKLPYNYQNDSALPYGVIAPNAFIQRMNFTVGEYGSNAAGVTEAGTFLPGGDFIGSPLWFVPANPGVNF